jgi:3-demethoxyubiquinol 3-hydroxylase
MNAPLPDNALPSTTAAPGLTVWYDGGCPICAREIGFYRRRRGAGVIHWVDLREDGSALPPGIDRKTALNRFTVQAADGRVLDGAPAFRAIWARLPAFRWAAVLTRPAFMQRLLDVGYAAFLRLRPTPPPDLCRFDALPPWLQRELRSDHAGELGAVFIYRAILLLSRDPLVRDFAQRHLATEQRHLDIICELVPRSRRSRLTPLWVAAAWTTGALPALAGRRAVFHTIEAVEIFVDGHYAAQVEALADCPELAGLRDTLAACREDELHHRDEARALAGRPAGPLARAWARAVDGGSRFAVKLARAC